MGCPSECTLGDNLTFSVCTHDPDTAILTDADAVPAYRVYEDETTAAILTGNMAKLDDVNTTGFYAETLAVTSGNGFEAGKSYSIYVTAVVGGDTGGLPLGFKVSKPTGFQKAVAVTAFSWTMVDSTDHVTLETGLQATLRAAGGAQISKDGGAFADLTNIASVNHIASGVYEVDLTAAEMNADSIALKFVAAGADTRIIYLKTSS